MSFACQPILCESIASIKGFRWALDLHKIPIESPVSLRFKRYFMIDVISFSSDSNYYGAAHSIIFIGTDYSCQEDDYDDCTDGQVRDTITAVITAKNDPPKIDSLPDYVMNENDTLWLKFGPYVSDVDDDTLNFKITALTYDDKMTIRPMGTNQDSIFESSSYEDSIQSFCRKPGPNLR